MNGNAVIWQPDAARRESSAMHRFMREQGASSYDELYDWSIENKQDFWAAMARFGGLQFDAAPGAVLRQPGDMRSAQWFPGAELNYAAHLLRRQGDGTAIVFCGEDGRRRELSFDELRAEVARVAAGLTAEGVGRGDRVAAFLPNCPEAIVAMLAASGIGAIWSSCSPDFGVNGVVDRFGQIAPEVLFCADGYLYNGRRHDSLAPVAGVVERIGSIARVVVVPFSGAEFEPPASLPTVAWSDFGTRGAPLELTPLPFDHPLFIMYSSGTTGVPKCIVHGAGGTLIQHLKEHLLHGDLREGDRLFYFTTCGWMMWNWLASGLAAGATLVLYDGAPFHDEGRVLWKMAERERVTHFGTSAKYLSALEKTGVRPKDECSLPELRVLFSTGSPLAPASFDFVYDGIAGDVQLSSITGGTDIISCFALGNPVLPVRRGEIQCLGLGMAVDVFDDEGRRLRGQSGELVCTASFPSMPVGFWDDSDGARYRAAYFERFPGVWAHGDYAEITEHRGLIVHGRSDAVLNPGGVRIGTAEIYRQVEKLDEVLESIAIGQEWQDDVRVVLFVVLREGVQLDEELRARIRARIRENTTPRHVPAKIVAVPEIPRTISGKIVELAVRAVVHGRPVGNEDALANPQALRHFRDLPELATD